MLHLEGAFSIRDADDAGLVNQTEVHPHQQVLGPAVNSQSSQ